MIIDRMINRIQVLPEVVINQIAAGEVIERPASILKELLENSLDANSSIIRIYLDNGGIKGIKVVDNGVGIYPEDLPLVFKQHATSKINNVSDLDSINSLGFRGEALASIAAISVVNISSNQLEPSGTTIEVKDIFYNLPVRKKFLRSSTTEFNYIQEMFKRLALSNFSVSFILYNNNKLIKSLPVINNAITNLEVDQELALKEQRIAKLVGNRFIENAFFFNIQANTLQLYGWISNIYDVSGSHIQYFYLNNRVVKDKLLNAAIREATKKLALPAAYCLYFKLDPMLVDINVHPTKQEVRFSDPKIIYAFVYESILEAFQQFKVKNSEINAEHIMVAHNYEINQENTDLDRNVNANVNMNFNELDFKNTNSIDLTNLTDSKNLINSTNSTNSINSTNSTNLTNSINSTNLKIFPIFNNQYVLFTGKILNLNELWVLNIKEGLQWLLANSLQQKDKLVGYKLIIPERVKLSNEISENFQEIINLLAEFKFDIGQIHADVLLVKSMPDNFYFFEIQIDYGRFFKELLKLQSQVIDEYGYEHTIIKKNNNENNCEINFKINNKIINLLIDCIKPQDLSVYAHKDLIRLITILTKENFVFCRLNQYSFEKML